MPHEEIVEPIRAVGRSSIDHGASCALDLFMPLVNRRRCSEGFARFSRGLLFAMASSENKRKDSYSSRHRSHKGCWTCKRKRVQCDETRPGCLKCSSRGLACEGYELRLRWGAGIASRGRFNGADKPVKESIPPHSKRRWDLRAKKEYIGGGDHQGQPELLLQQEFTPGKKRLDGASICHCCPLLRT